MRTWMGRRLARTAVMTTTVAAVALGGGAVPALAGPVFSPMVEGTATQKITGLPGKQLQVIFSNLGGPSSTLGLVIVSRNAARTARAEDAWRVNGATIDCTTSLSSCTASDAGVLGTYGQVDLAFAATKPGVKRDLVCFGTNVVYAKQVRRAGVLTGTLRLSTKSKKLGTIRNGSGAHRVKATIPITMRRTVYTGMACPNVDTCPASAWLNADGYKVSGYRRLPTGKGATGFTRSLTSLAAGVDRDWYVSSRGAGSAALTLSTPSSLAAATLGMSLSNPFVTGTVAFAATDPKTSTTFLGCAVEAREGELSVDIAWRIPGYAKVDQSITYAGRLIRDPS